MASDPSSLALAIAAGAFLAGIAFAILAFLVPDLLRGIQDLRRGRSLLSDDRTARAVERAISARTYVALSILGGAAVVIAVVVLSL
jgi:uncharacterized protein (DUF2236 family)